MTVDAFFYKRRGSTRLWLASPQKATYWGSDSAFKTGGVQVGSMSWLGELFVLCRLWCLVSDLSLPNAKVSNLASFEIST